MWLMFVLGCAVDPAALSSVAPDDGQRLQLPALSFDAWSDVLVLQAGADDACEFLPPLVDDDTTHFAPLQTYWVIHDDVDDVASDGWYDVFFRGDEVAAADFPDRRGLEPLGFAPLSTWSRAMLPLDAMAVDGSLLTARFGGSIGVSLEVEIVPDDGGCVPETLACLEPCAGGWVPLEGIDVAMGDWGVDAVTLR